MEQADGEEGEKVQRRFQAGSGASDGGSCDHRRLAQQLGVRRKLLYQWRDQLQAEGRAGLERRRGRPPGSKSQALSPPSPSAAELRIAELERLLGRKQLEVDFLKRAFEQVGGAASNRTSDGGKGSIAQSKPRSRSKEQH
jgi:transposase